MSTESGSKAPSSAAQILDGGDSYVDIEGTKYLLAFMERTDHTTPTAYNFCHVMEDIFDDEIKGFPTEPKKATKKGDTDPPTYPKEKLPQRNKVNKKDWALVKEFLQERLNELIADKDQYPPAALTQLEQIGQHLKLSPQEEKILRLLYVIEYSGPLHMVMQQLVDSDEKMGPTIARMFDDEKNHAAYTKAISEQGKLATYDIIAYGPSECRFPVISRDTEDLLNLPDLSGEDIKKSMVGPPTSTDLTREDFTYLEPDLGLLIGFLREAAAKGEVGINVLLDGPTGGGKTELAKVIIAEAGLKGFSIGENYTPGKRLEKTVSDDGFGNTESFLDGDIRQEGEKRFAALVRGDKLLEDDDKSIMHFDEFEDLLIKSTDSTKPADTHSKVGINGFMYRNKRPIIHCGNNPEKFDPSLRNRFSFSIFVDYPPIQVRVKIWKKQLELQKYELSDDDVLKLARKYDASPRQITNAIRFAKITERGIEAIDRCIPASARITSGSRTNAVDSSAPSSLYTPALSNIKADTDSRPEALIEKAKKGIPFSLFVKGPAGSGLQALTKHLAEGLVKNVDEASMLELSTPSQQATPEDKVASAFMSASNSGRFLVIHDIEHLSAAPDSKSSWNNEHLPLFFVEMARKHDQPFAVTTTKTGANGVFPGYLLNSFSDHVTLNAMTEEQKKKAFPVFFDCEFPDAADIKSLPELVVGDFAAVKHYLQRVDRSKFDEGKIIDLLQRQSKDRSEMANGSSFMGLHQR